jgi:hypothetical protein
MRPLSRIIASASLLVLIAAAPLGASTVSKERLGDAIDHAYYSAIAVGPDGVVHRVWREGAGADTESVLMYARSGPDGWTTETVDTREPTLRSDDIAVDAEGRVHVAYYWNNREDPLQPRCSVVHAVREAEGWVHTTLATPDVFAGTALAVDPAGRPRVAWLKSLGMVDGVWQKGPAVVASFNGTGWDLVDLPVEGTPWDLHVDPQGHSHFLVSASGTDLQYLTDASGDWAEEELPAALRVARLTIGSDGIAHIAGFGVDESNSQRLHHLVRGSSGWEADAMLDDPGAQFRRSDLHFESGPDGRLFILYGEQRQEVWDGDADRWLHSFDGQNWTKESFATRENSAEVNATAVGPDGILHVICGGREAGWIDYFRIGGPAFDYDSSDLRVVPTKDGVRVRGRLRMRNLDYARASGERSLRFARATRDEARSGDTSLARERRIRSMRPGSRRNIRVSVRVDDPTPDERLLLFLVHRWGTPERDADPETAGVVPLGE